jgi:hypothetical protein
LEGIAEEFGSYVVRHYRRDPERLIVVFASAKEWGSPVEEFRTTLSPFDVSLCFIVDSKPTWLNHPETPEMLDHVAEIAAGYRHVGAMGESMGGSSAILFGGRCRDVDRVLAFSPQFSVANPLIQADSRFSHLGDAMSQQRYWTFDSRNTPRETVIIHGDEDWFDLVHAGLYAVYGYDVGFVRGAGHMVSRGLRDMPGGNALRAVAARFADFSAPFTYDSVAQVLPGQISRQVDSRRHGFESIKEWDRRFYAAAKSPQRPPPPEGLRDLTRGALTNQSSVSRWSSSQVTEEDSAGAISGRLTADFAFHTSSESRPWWSIDLGEETVVRMMRIFNRLYSMEAARRGADFAIEVSDDGSDWREVYRKNDHALFGGADGLPFVWAPVDGVPARRLRVRLLGWGQMHYDQIEIFG